MERIDDEDDAQHDGDQRGEKQRDEGRALCLDRRNDQRGFPHAVDQKEGAQYQGEEREDHAGPEEREDGKGHGKHEQEQVSAGRGGGFMSLDVPPQVADGVDCCAGGQGPHEYGAADCGEEEERQAQCDIEHRDPHGSGSAPEELKHHRKYPFGIKIRLEKRIMWKAERTVRRT